MGKEPYPVQGGDPLNGIGRMLARRRVARFLNLDRPGRAGADMADTNRTAAPVRKVIVVNRKPEVLEMSETMLDAGRYDMVFVESGDRPYSQIKKVKPDLIVLCARIEDLQGLQRLTMLKLDADTHEIPVLTCIAGCEGLDRDEAISQRADDDEFLFPACPVPQTN